MSTLRALRLARCALLAVLMLLVAVPAAYAAYAPQLDIDIDPPTPESPVAITSTITQASGETASRTVRVVFPAGFAAGLKTKVVPCKQEQADSEAGCPPESLVGSGRAVTDIATLTGPVYLVLNGSQLRLYIPLKGLAGLLDVPVYGDIVLGGGRVSTVFDNLPETTTTLFELKLEGGDKALSVTPKTCGTGVFEGEFTSHQDEKAADTSEVVIAGCATTPVISAVSVSPRAFRAVRRFSDTQRRGFSTTLRYTLSEATNGARVKIYKRVRRRWRYVGSFIAGGEAGPNRVRFDGRVRNRRLSPGRYRFTVRTVNRAGRASNTGAATFAIRS